MITLDQCYQQFQGQSVLVDGVEADRGQCVQWADLVLNLVYGLPYHYGNAIDWWNNPGELLQHFDKITDGSVKKGDFVIFNTLVGSQYGHIDVAMQDGSKAGFQGADSNWGGNLTVHLVQHNNPSYVLGSLRLKGVSDMIPDQHHLDAVFQRFFGRNSTAAEQAEWIGKKGYTELIDVLQSQQAYKDQVHYSEIGYQTVTKGVTPLKSGLYQV